MGEMKNIEMKIDWEMYCKENPRDLNEAKAVKGEPNANCITSTIKTQREWKKDKSH